MIDDDATQFSYFGDDELTQLAEINTDNPSDEEHKALEEGTIFLNKYKVLKVLGEGSFSLIYLLEANDASKKLLVAKEFFPKGFVTRNNNNEVILKTSLTEKEIENYHFMKDIFIGEAQNLVKVSSRTHLNVLNFFSLEENINNTMYLITDYEEGITLKEYIRQRNKEYKGKLNNQEITLLLQSLLSGLEHIHNVGVYHQDIKLENILIREDHSPILLDFGASIVLYDEKRKKYFNATTPRYASPEQIELSQPPAIDGRSDIYALGVLAYKLVTDTFPPKASERLRAMNDQHDDLYIPLEIQKVYGYDMVVLKAIDRALNIIPEERFQNTKEFIQALVPQKKFNFSPEPKVLLGLVVSTMIIALFFFWPNSKGTAKLNVKEKTYFLYSDGEKVPISEEKTVLLPTGTHHLTFIKDGFVPYEINTTIEPNKITNVTGHLIPTTSLIELSSNIDNAMFIVNNEQIENNSFNGRYNETYTIKTIALDHPSETVEIRYRELYEKHFRFYQKLKLKNKVVAFKINNPLNKGETVVKVNNKIIKDNIFSAEESQAYEIEISNQYLKTISMKKTYKELEEDSVLTVNLEQGEGELYIKGLLPDVLIETYQKNNGLDKKVSHKSEYKEGIVFIKLKAAENLFFKFSKSGYKSITSEIFTLKNGDKLEKSYILDKVEKVLPKLVPPEIKPIKNIVKEEEKIQKRIVKQVQKPSVKVKEKKKRTKIKKAVKKKKRTKIKKVVKKKKRTKIKKVVKKPKYKRKTTKKRAQTGGSIWYCVASNNGIGSYSAKRNSRKKAYNSAIQLCRKKTRKTCNISSCYLWSN